MSKRKQFLAILAVVGMALVLVGCGQKKTTTTTGSEKINVMTTTDVYSDIVAEIGGKEVEVTPIIKSTSQDPHDFEATTETAKEVTKAQLVISNGLGYDDWIDRVTKAADTKQLNIGEDALKLKLGTNPHIWFNLDYMIKAAKAIEAKLVAQKPSAKIYFATNTKKLTTKLEKIQTQLGDAKAKAGTTSKTVFTSEPVFDYPLEASGLEIGNKDFEQAIEREIDPTPKVIAKMKKDLTSGNVLFFVQNSQVENTSVTSMVKIAKANDIPILEVTETKPAKTSYVQWMEQMYGELEKLMPIK